MSHPPPTQEPLLAMPPALIQSSPPGPGARGRDEAERLTDFSEAALSCFADLDRQTEQKRLRKDRYRQQHPARGY